MSDNSLYFDLNSHERESAIRYLLGAIIRCRNEEGIPSNYYTYDEDVNVYLAHLLFAVSLPEYQEMAEPYLSKESSDVLRWVSSTEDQTIRYFIYKVNADYLLIHTAIFDDLLKQSHHKIFKRSSGHYRELAKLYYDQAATYHKRIYRKKTGVGDVLEKLGHYYELYQTLLKHVRRDYFDFMTNFKDQAFRYFIREVRDYENQTKKKIKMDEFLDLYAQWIKTKNPDLEKELMRVVSELKTLDPGLDFGLINRKINEKGGADDERKCA